MPFFYHDRQYMHLTSIDVLVEVLVENEVGRDSGELKLCYTLVWQIYVVLYDVYISITLSVYV